MEFLVIVWLATVIRILVYVAAVICTHNQHLITYNSMCFDLMKVSKVEKRDWSRHASASLRSYNQDRVDVLQTILESTISLKEGFIKVLPTKAGE